MKRKNKKIYIFLIILTVIGLSIGYAVLNSTLIINGVSNIQKNVWSIHFENVEITSGSVEAVKVPMIVDNTSIDFETKLNLPGDYYEFTVDVKNSGTIDAMIESIIKEPELTIEQQKYLNYIIEYHNGEQLGKNQLVKANEFVRLKVRVEMKKDLSSSDLPDVGEVLNLGFTVNYVQADNNGISVKDNGTWLISANGLLEDIGTVVTIGTEKFYTIGTEGENVKLLPMMNITFDDDPVQSSILNETAYSSDEQKGINYSSYEGSIVEGYVNNYKNKLEIKFGVEISEARLITRNEIFDEKLGCDSSSMSCLNTPYPWLYSISYWAFSSNQSSTSIFAISKTGIFDGTYYYKTLRCVRPVIVVPKSEITVNLKPVAEGDINEIGTVVTIGTEQFYTIGTEENNVKLLSMYNLHVGNIISGIVEEDDNEIPIVEPITGPKGFQSSRAIGAIFNFNTETYTFPWVGTTVFSSEEQHGEKHNSYEGSIVEGYVNNYENLLEEKYDVDVLSSRLLIFDELVGLISGSSDCIEGISSGSCLESTYPWLFSTSYWTGIYFSDDDLGILLKDGYFLSMPYFGDGVLGVRPVIIISKDSFK